MAKHPHLCCLCGKPAAPDDPITREHVPPKQFYPKSLRSGSNLWIAPTHRSCNASAREDEEYFLVAAFPIVQNANAKMASLLEAEIRRRSKSFQIPTLMRSVYKFGHDSLRGQPYLDLDKRRMDRIALKIARCLFYRDHTKVMPLDNCKDIRLCETPGDVPDFYTASWELDKLRVADVPVNENGIAVPQGALGLPRAVLQEVFDYRLVHSPDLQLYLITLRFWQSFMYCMAFTDSLVS